MDLLACGTFSGNPLEILVVIFVVIVHSILALFGLA